MFFSSLLEESLKYITSISRLLEGDVEEMTVKYLRVLLHKVYHIVEKVGLNMVDINMIT